MSLQKTNLFSPFLSLTLSRLKTFVKILFEGSKLLCKQVVNGVQTAGPGANHFHQVFGLSTFNCGRCNGHGFGGKAFRSPGGILQRIAAVEVLILHFPNTQMHQNSQKKGDMCKKKCQAIN